MKNKKTIIAVIITVIVTAAVAFWTSQTLEGIKNKETQKEYENTSYAIEEGSVINDVVEEEEKSETPEFYYDEDGTLMNTTDQDAVCTEEIGMDADGNFESDNEYEEAHCKADGYVENMKALGYPK